LQDRINVQLSGAVRIVKMKAIVLLFGLIGVSTQALAEAATGQAATPGAVTFDQLEGVHR
jgi:hypothetical protein